jgi:hypothetical protein
LPARSVSAFLRPDLGNMLGNFAYFADRILDLREVAAEPLDRLRVRPVGDGSKPRRLDEAKHVRRNRHPHVVTAAQQLPTDGDAGFNVAPTSIACHHKLHRRNLTRGDAPTSKQERYRLTHGVAVTSPSTMVRMTRSRGGVPGIQVHHRGGAYWSVVDAGTYETVTAADRFLQYVRFGRGRAESTTRKYAEAIALYRSYCVIRCADWTEPDIAAFQIWLRVAPSLRRPATSNSHFDGSTPVRGDNHINLISYAVCEMFRFAAAEGLWSSDRLGVLFETAQVRTRAADRRQASVSLITLRRRHRLRPELSRRRDAPVDVVKALIGACQNSRDVFMLTVLATTGLRRGEVLGLRLSDIHLLPRPPCSAARRKVLTCMYCPGRTAMAPG